MKAAAAIALTLLLGGQSAPAQLRVVVAGPPAVPSDPSASLIVSPPGPIAPGTLVTLDATASAGDDFGFDSDVDESLYRIDTGGRLLYFVPPAPGVYRFKAESFGLTGGKVKVARARVAVTVGSPPGPGPAPVPPIPIPPPIPADRFRAGDPVRVTHDLAASPPIKAGTPGTIAGKSAGYPDGKVWDVTLTSGVYPISGDYLEPGSGPGPNPVPDVVGNLRVVLLYESSDPMTPAQRATIFSTTKVIPYLESHCLKGADGRAGWRFWDKDVNVANEPAEWQDAMAKAKADPGPLPKIVAFAGNTPLPSHPVTSEADALAFLQQVGGK